MGGGIDPKTGGLYAIDVFHAKVHERRAYAVSFIGDGLDAGSVADILVRLNSSVEWHIDISAAATAAANVFIFEAPGITGSGDIITAYNRYREAGETVNGTFYAGPTLANTGITIVSSLLPGATKIQFSGGSQGAERQEWVFKPNSVYAFRVKNESASDIKYSMNLNLYEVDG